MDVLCGQGHGRMGLGVECVLCMWVVCVSCVCLCLCAFVYNIKLQIYYIHKKSIAN